MLQRGGKTGAQETEWPPFAQGRSSKMLSFRCFKACMELTFVVSSLKILFWTCRCCCKRFESISLKTVHVQPSGGHSDGPWALCKEMTIHKSIFKMFLML